MRTRCGVRSIWPTAASFLSLAADWAGAQRRRRAGRGVPRRDEVLRRSATPNRATSASASATDDAVPRRSGRRTGTSSRFCTRSTSRCRRSGLRASRPTRASPALVAIASTGARSACVDRRSRTRRCSVRLGLLTNGSLDRTWTTPDGRVHHYRTAGGTGAQYHLELYFVCTELADLAAGVYHYSAIDHSLRLLRSGDHRATLIEATGNEPSVATAPVVLAMTSTFWRNAWRYRERAYRHTYWDAGTSLCAHPRGRGIGARRDQAGVRLRRPAGQRAARRRRGARSHGGARRARPRRGRTAERTADPAARPTHTAAVLGRGDLPRDHRHAPRFVAVHPGREPHGGARAGGADRPHNRPASSPTCARCPPTGSIRARRSRSSLRRRSTRNYDTDVEIPFDAFSTLLDRSTRGVASDALVPRRATHRPLPDRERRPRPHPGHLPAPSAARRGRAPPRRHVPREATRIAAPSDTRETRTSTSTTSRTCRRSWTGTATAATASRSSKAPCTQESCTSARTLWDWARWAPRRSTTR